MAEPGRHALLAEPAWVLLAVGGASLAVAAIALAMLLRQRRRGVWLSASLARATTALDTLAMRDPLTGPLSCPEFELALEDAASWPWAADDWPASEAAGVFRPLLFEEARPVDID